jgi:hypothetical protein
VHQLFIVASLQLLLAALQTIFLSVHCQDFQFAEKKSAKIKINVFFLVKNRRDLTPQKLPVFR